MTERPALQLERDEKFESTWKIVQRVLIVVLWLAVIGGLAGLFGRGPLAKASQAVPGTDARISFERIMRDNTPSQMAVQWKRAPGAEMEVALDGPLLGAVQVSGTTPTAKAYHTDGDGAAWRFDVQPGAPGRIAFDIQPYRAGLVRGHMRVSGQTVAVSASVFP